MEEQGKAAPETEAPSLEDAAKVETPAVPQPEPSPKELVGALEAKITELRAELAMAKSTASESSEAARRTQSQIRSIESRLDKKIETLSSLLDGVATVGMDETALKTWRLQRELEKERENRTTYDSELQRQKAEDEWRTYSAAVLAEEQIPADNPVLREAYGRYVASAKDPSDWKAALGRAIAEVRRDEAKRAEARTKEIEAKAREDERAKLRNEKRSEAGPVDRGSTVSVSHRPYLDMSDEEFAIDSANKKRERDQRLMRINR